MSAEAPQPPPIRLPFPLRELNGGSIAFTEHRNCEMIRNVGKLIATEDQLIIETTSLRNEAYQQIARSFVLSQIQADAIRPLPKDSAVQWELPGVLSGGEFSTNESEV